MVNYYAAWHIAQALDMMKYHKTVIVIILKSPSVICAYWADSAKFVATCFFSFWKDSYDVEE